LALILHGIEVFGSAKALENWLHTQNFYFDNQKPQTSLNMVAGIKFVDDRLTATEYGANM